MRTLQFLGQPPNPSLQRPPPTVLCPLSQKYLPATVPCPLQSLRAPLACAGNPQVALVFDKAARKVSLPGPYGGDGS